MKKIIKNFKLEEIKNLKEEIKLEFEQLIKNLEEEIKLKFEQLQIQLQIQLQQLLRKIISNFQILKYNL